MKFKWDKRYLYWGITAFLVIVLSISFFIMLNNYKSVWGVLQTIFKILKPFTIGLVIAYLLNPIMTFFEVKVFTPLFGKTKLKKSRKRDRVVALSLTMILALLFVFALVSMVLPQLVTSINGIVNNVSVYATNLDTWISQILASNEGLAEFLSSEVKDINTFIIDWAKNNLLPQLNNVIGGVTVGVIGVVVLLKDIFVGLMISIYVLYSKEIFSAQTKKFLYGIMPVGVASRFLSITRRSHFVFGKFIIGKLIDSLVIGIICFAGMSIFNMPYALLISVIIGITNIIPFFGPFIGAIPSAILILMIDPLTCLYFVIFVLALQQFDGNILGPKILGDSTGLSAFWVIFAILLGGGLFGFPGMIVGVPAFAVIYSIIVETLGKRLKKRDLPVDTNEYYNLDHISKEDNTPIYEQKADI